MPPVRRRMTLIDERVMVACTNSGVTRGLATSDIVSFPNDVVRIE